MVVVAQPRRRVRRILEPVRLLSRIHRCGTPSSTATVLSPTPEEDEMISSKPKIRFKTIDEYLAPLKPEQRAALERLRKTIKAAAPKAAECISYQVPAFKQNGLLVAFGATPNHCSFYPGDGATVASLKEELKDFDTSKAAIRFQPD